MADASVIIILCSTQFTALSFFGFSSARGFIVGKCLEASSLMFFYVFYHQKIHPNASNKKKDYHYPSFLTHSIST